MCVDVFLYCLFVFSQAVKSAAKKTKQMLKDVAVVATIHKARKTFWFVLVLPNLIGEKLFFL